MGNKGSSHSSTLSRGQGATSDIRDALASLPGSAPTNKTGRYFPQRPGSATTVPGGRKDRDRDRDREGTDTSLNLLRTRLINHLAAAHLPLGAEGVVLASLMHLSIEVMSSSLQQRGPIHLVHLALHWFCSPPRTKHDLRFALVSARGFDALVSLLPLSLFATGNLCSTI